MCDEQRHEIVVTVFERALIHATAGKKIPECSRGTVAQSRYRPYSETATGFRPLCTTAMYPLIGHGIYARSPITCRKRLTRQSSWIAIHICKNVRRRR